MRLMLILLLLSVLSACQDTDMDKREKLEPVTGHVTELEKTACFTADEAGTCETRLPSLGFVTKEECCERYGKCC